MLKSQNRGIVLLAAAMIIFVASVFHVAEATYSLDSIFKTPTLEECVKMTGMTEDECREAFSGISNDMKGASIDMNGLEGMEGSTTTKDMLQDFSDEINQQAEGETLTEKSGQQKVSGNTSLSNVRSERARSEQNFSKVEKRVEALIDFFKMMNFDINPLRENLSIFREKQQAVLDEQDALIDDFSKLNVENSGVDDQTIANRKASVEEKTQDVVDFYKDTLRKSAADLVDQLK